jgi:hypothetical protein
MNKLSLLQRFQNMEMKEALELTLLELLEGYDELVLDDKTWEVLFALGGSLLGASKMTVKAKVTAALDDLEQKEKIQLVSDGKGCLVIKKKEKEEE